MTGKGNGQFEQRNQSNLSLGYKETNKNFQSYVSVERECYIVRILILKFNKHLRFFLPIFIIY